jgi:hypothetical protein
MTMTSADLTTQNSKTGTLEKVWLIEIQARPEDANKIIDQVLKVDPLIYGRYGRNAFVSAVGTETYMPQANSTSALHLSAEGKVQTFSSAVITISVSQASETLSNILDAIREAHHYEEPLIFVTESWASRANYDPHNSNPNRWWNQAH